MDKPASEVTLRLSAHETSSAVLEFPTRCVTLTRKNNQLAVGRTSKVESKGLLARVDNAYFDSPVMSRKHAVIVADLNQKKMQVMDAGSLHGTYLNNDNGKLCVEGKPADLNNGDVLRFGVPVLRGHDTFPALCLRVGFEFNNEDENKQGTSTFKVPETSDNSESEDDMSDDDAASVKENTSPSVLMPPVTENLTAEDNVSRIHHLSQDPALIKAEPEMRRPSHLEAIDLTRITQTPAMCVALKRELIDLTQAADDSDSEESESDIELGSDKDCPIDRSSPPRAISLDVSENVLLSVGNNDENLYLSRESSVEAIPEEDTSSTSAGPPTLHSASSAYDTRIPPGIVDALNAAVTEVKSAEDPSYPSYGNDDESIRLSDSENDDSIDSASSVGHDVYNRDAIDGYHDGELSEYEASDRGFESELDEMELEDDYPSEEEDEGYGDSSVDPIWDDSSESADSEASEKDVPLTSSTAPFAAQQAHAPSFTNSGPSCVLPPLGASLLPPFNAYVPNSVSCPNTAYQFNIDPINRLFPHSPSDAPFPPTFSRPEAPFAPTESQMTAETLGTKAGKPEFFAAREVNKRVFSPTVYRDPTIAFNAPPPQAPDMPVAPAVQPDVSPSSSLTDAQIDGRRTGDQEATSTQYELRAQPAPESASRRTHVGISDIVENCDLPVSDMTKGKRKAEDISDVTANQLQWESLSSSVDAARSPVSSLSGHSTDTAATSVATSVDSKMEESSSVPKQMNETAVVASSVDEASGRPTKRPRLSRVAERLGFAAFGGLTGVAIVVSSLIYTAPTFS